MALIALAPDGQAKHRAHWRARPSGAPLTAHAPQVGAATTVSAWHDGGAATYSGFPYAVADAHGCQVHVVEPWR